MKNLNVWGLSLPVLLALTGAVAGQNFTGSVTGVVSDQNGTVIACAQITLTNSATTETREIKSNEDWRFTFAQSQPAIYTLATCATTISTLTAFSTTATTDAHRDRADNRAQFGRANTTFGNPAFGRVTGAAPDNGPRTIQMALRLEF